MEPTSTRRPTFRGAALSPKGECTAPSWSFASTAKCLLCTPRRVPVCLGAALPGAGRLAPQLILAKRLVNDDGIRLTSGSLAAKPQWDVNKAYTGCPHCSNVPANKAEHNYLGTYTCIPILHGRRIFTSTNTRHVHSYCIPRYERWGITIGG